MSDPAQDDRSTLMGAATTTANPSPPKQMTVCGAIFLGVGAMVGAGIFAPLG